MAYPQDLLAEGEDELVHEHPHWKVLVAPVLALLGTVAVGGYLGALVGGTDWAAQGRIALAVLGSAVLAWATLVPLLRWRTTHFVVTTSRVLVREGILSRSGMDLPVHRVNSVQFRQTLLERLLGCGTLVIESAAEEPLEFDDVPHVERVQTVLHQEVGAVDGPYQEHW